MNFKKITLIRFAVSLLAASIIAGCEDFVEKPKHTELTTQQEQLVQRFEHASYVLSSVIADKAMREELNGFVLAKVKKSGTDEELTFHEMFSGKSVNLHGVAPDFLARFRDAFITTLISGNYRHADKFKETKFKTAEDVKAYFWQQKPTAATRQAENGTDNLEFPQDPDFEVYVPYSENFEGVTYNYYAVTYNPVYTVEENTGEVFNAVTGTYVDIVPVDDEYAWGTPTYIVTFDDGLNLADFNYGMPIDATNYKITLTDDDYLPTVIESVLDDPNPSPCTTELRVKDGRWTLLNNGYGLFEGKIEFACAVTRDLSEVTIPTQGSGSNPIIKIDKTAHAWAYIKIKRKKVKDMRDDLSKSVNFGLNVSPWCAGQQDKMIFLYEYDKPWLLSSHSKEFSEVIANAANLIADSTIRANVLALGIAPMIQAILEGTAQSQIEYYGIVGSNAVVANQGVPTNGIDPHLLNGFRLYGKSSVCASLVVD
jgi:hypothetical protein